jgi:hypothetical protein
MKPNRQKETWCLFILYYLRCQLASHAHAEGRSWRCVVDATLSNKVCQWLSTGRWVSPGSLVSSTSKTDRHDINEILLKE